MEVNDDNLQQVLKDRKLHTISSSQYSDLDLRQQSLVNPILHVHVAVPIIYRMNI